MSEPASQGCAWITGASTGLGRALALRLAREGWTVVASARSGDKLDALSREANGLPGTIAAEPLDVTDRDAVAASVERVEAAHGAIALAVMNAGAHQPMTGADFGTEAFRALVELNLMGVVHALDAVLPRMIGRGAGHIAIVASMAGYRGLPTACAYGATKAAVGNMAEALRPELEHRGVKLQLVNPGFVKTPLTESNRFPMPFLMEVEDAAEAFYRGLQSDRFEIIFPRRFAYIMKALGMLPYPLLFAVTRKLVTDHVD